MIFAVHIAALSGVMEGKKSCDWLVNEWRLQQVIDQLWESRKGALSREPSKPMQHPPFACVTGAGT